MSNAHVLWPQISCWNTAWIYQHRERMHVIHFWFDSISIVHHIQFTQYSHGFSKISWILKDRSFSSFFFIDLNIWWLWNEWVIGCGWTNFTKNDAVIATAWNGWMQVGIFFLHLVKMLIKMDCAPNFDSLARFETSEILAVVCFCFSEMLSQEMPYFNIYLSIDCLRWCINNWVVWISCLVDVL